MAGNRPVVSEYVEVSNELESTLNKVRDATDQYNETLSANKIAMKTLMDMYKISADDINGQGEAIKDLIKRKEQELADINKEIATTEDEIISRNKRAEAVENEIKRLKELGRTNEKAQEAANKIARQAAKTQLDLEKQLSKSILELRQASLEKDLELSRLRFSWECQELENKLKYDKTLTAESREAINLLILNMEERRYKEESEIRQRWSDKEFEEEAAMRSTGSKCGLMHKINCRLSAKKKHSYLIMTFYTHLIRTRILRKMPPKWILRSNKWMLHKINFPKYNQ